MSNARQRFPREVWVLVSAAFLIAIGFGLVAPALPQYARQFGVSMTLVSAVVSIFALMRLVSAPASGQLVKRLGERRIYLIGLGIVAISTGACAFTQEFWQLLTLRAISGIGSSMFTVSAMALLIRVTPANARGKVSSFYGGSFLIGGIFGPIVGAALLTLGPEWAFIIYGVSLLLALSVVAVALRAKRLSPGDNSVETQPESREVFGFGEAIRIPAFRSLMFSGFANGWAVFGFRMAVIPLFVVEVLRQREEMAGLALGLFALGNAAVIIPAGRLSDRWGRKWFIISGASLSGVSLILIGQTQSVVIFVVLALISGLGSGLFGPSQQAALADIIGNKRNGGPSIAAFQMTADLGAVIGPLVAGVIIDVSSFGAAFAVTGALLLVAAVFWVVNDETLARSKVSTVTAAVEVQVR